jgi:serine/threonine protein kinase
MSSSEEVRQRFEREAKTISSLSHPHICALYDVGNQDGVEYLVMEYLEGETLADRLGRPLPAEQVLRAAGSRWPTRWTRRTGRGSCTRT